MSASGHTPEAQLRYILQWFQEFSELQREDFLPVLVAAHEDKPNQLVVTLSNISCQDKPVSLFQCRIKLFNEWYPSWAAEDKDRMIHKISEIDPAFGNKLQDALLNGLKVNGDSSEIYARYDETISTNGNNMENNVEPPADETENIEVPTAAQDNISIEIAAAS